MCPQYSLLRASYFLAFVLLAGCGPSVGHREQTESIAERLSKLSFTDIMALGRHRSETELTTRTESRGRSQAISEHYDLRWEGWEQFQYQVTKGEFMVMDFTVWKGKAYQRQFGGRTRIRDNPSEMHYYLRQTWNQWNGVAEAFRSVLVYESAESVHVEGRPVETYHIRLAPQVEPNPGVTQRLRQSVEHDRVEGELWIDKATGVPLQIVFHGEYRVIRFSRRPGKPGETTRHWIEFKLRRYNIGQPQEIESPAVARSP